MSAPSPDPRTGHRAMSVTVLGHNQDGRLTFTCQRRHGNVLLVNDARAFTDQALQAGGRVSMPWVEAAGSMAATIGDCNGDGWDDLFVTRLGYARSTWATHGGFTRTEWPPPRRASSRRGLSAGRRFVDYDNDSDLDIFIANGDALYCWVGKPAYWKTARTAPFSDAARRGGSSSHEGPRTGQRVADFDNDGRMDILATRWRPPFLLGPRQSRHHWLKLDSKAAQQRDGFGR